MFGTRTRPNITAAAYKMAPALTPDSMIMTATNKELMANSVSSMPGIMEPVNINMRVSARHIPPRAIADVFFLLTVSFFNF